jgi:hypothetical protein
VCEFQCESEKGKRLATCVRVREAGDLGFFSFRTLAAGWGGAGIREIVFM